MDKETINKLCRHGEKVIESERFRGLYYLIKDGSVCLLTFQNGKIAIALECVPGLCEELSDIFSVWNDVKTKNCAV